MVGGCVACRLQCVDGSAGWIQRPPGTACPLQPPPASSPIAARGGRLAGHLQRGGHGVLRQGQPAAGHQARPLPQAHRPVLCGRGPVRHHLGGRAGSAGRGSARGGGFLLLHAAAQLLSCAALRWLCLPVSAGRPPSCSVVCASGERLLAPDGASSTAASRMRWSPHPLVPLYGPLSPHMLPPHLPCSDAPGGGLRHPPPARQQPGALGHQAGERAAQAGPQQARRLRHQAHRLRADQAAEGQLLRAWALRCAALPCAALGPSSRLRRACSGGVLRSLPGIGEDNALAALLWDGSGRLGG
jgi:hypothetical protein